MSIGRMIGRPGEPNGRAANGRAEVMPDGGSGGPNPLGFEQMCWLEHKPRTTALQDDNARTANYDKKFPTLHSLIFVVVRRLGLVGC